MNRMVPPLKGEGADGRLSWTAGTMFTGEGRLGRRCPILGRGVSPIDGRSKGIDCSSLLRGSCFALLSGPASV